MTKYLARKSFFCLNFKGFYSSFGN